MSRTLVIQNRQRLRRIDTRQLRRVALWVAEQLWPNQPFELGVCLLDAPEMTRMNETYLRHEGCTDVITFDYSPAAGRAPFNVQSSRFQVQGSRFEVQHSTGVHGEIFICVTEAVAQAGRFRSTWPGELVRYVIHGLLHLRGFDDLKPAERRRMKRQEARLLRDAARRFALSRIAAAPGVSRGPHSTA